MAGDGALHLENEHRLPAAVISELRYNYHTTCKLPSGTVRLLLPPLLFLVASLVP